MAHTAERPLNFSTNAIYKWRPATAIPIIYAYLTVTNGVAKYSKNVN